MNHATHSRIARWYLVCALAALPGAALAARDSGDSSMNPYTGDSYAYFNGGHNLGEGGTIRPGGAPPSTGWQLYPWRGRAASEAAPNASPRPAQTPGWRTAGAPGDDAPTTAR